MVPLQLLYLDSKFAEKCDNCKRHLPNYRGTHIFHKHKYRVRYILYPRDDHKRSCRIHKKVHKFSKKSKNKRTIKNIFRLTYFVWIVASETFASITNAVTSSLTFCITSITISTAVRFRYFVHFWDRTFATSTEIRWITIAKTTFQSAETTTFFRFFFIKLLIT